MGGKCASMRIEALCKTGLAAAVLFFPPDRDGFCNCCVHLLKKVANSRRVLALLARMLLKHCLCCWSRDWYMVSNAEARRRSHNQHSSFSNKIPCLSTAELPAWLAFLGGLGIICQLNYSIHDLSPMGTYLTCS